MGREIEASGDVAKIVVKPHSEENVLDVPERHAGVPPRPSPTRFIAPTSYDTGPVTRLIGGLFGIDRTFETGVKGSNPAHMPVHVMHDSLSAIYPATKEADRPLPSPPLGRVNTKQIRP